MVYYLCLQSCLRVNKPERILFHYHHEPYGEWWERIKPDLELHQVEPERFVIDNPAYTQHHEGLFIRANALDYAHQADFLRLKILIEHGGVYADMDTIFVKPLSHHFFFGIFKQEDV